MENILNCQIYRRFGVEIEVNTSSGVVKRPNSSLREIPLGSDRVSRIISSVVKEKVKLMDWDHVNNNTCWIVKPDNSCGIEINTPVLKGWRGLRKLMLVEEALKQAGVKSDFRCSLHVHVNIADLSETQLASVIAHYIKCEAVFFDSVPWHRKNNRYCQLIGMTDTFDHNFRMDADELIRKVSGTKYYSVNAFHFVHGGGFVMGNSQKRTIEFRIMESHACLDPWTTKNWVRLLLHFVERTKDRALPPPYRAGDPWSSLCWLDPIDVFSLLGFDGSLSPGLKQVRHWFLSRLLLNCVNPDIENIPAIWKMAGRRVAFNQIIELAKADDSYDLDEKTQESLYGKKYVV